MESVGKIISDRGLLFSNLIKLITKVHFWIKQGPYVFISETGAWLGCMGPIMARLDMKRGGKAHDQSNDRALPLAQPYSSHKSKMRVIKLIRSELRV